jgi:hypothetical protein
MKIEMKHVFYCVAVVALIVAILAYKRTVPPAEWFAVEMARCKERCVNLHKARWQIQVINNNINCTCHDNLNPTGML